METTIAVDKQLMQINYFAPILLSKAAVSHWLESHRSGRIGMISSVQGLFGIPDRSAYAASKHALHGWAESILCELPRDITVTTICPGYVRTELSMNALTASGQRYNKMDATTAGGMEPAYVAQIACRAIARGDPLCVIADLKSRIAWRLSQIYPSWLHSQLRSRYAKQSKQ